jgi:hypothetical protein
LHATSAYVVWGGAQASTADRQLNVTTPLDVEMAGDVSLVRPCRIFFTHLCCFLAG